MSTQNLNVIEPLSLEQIDLVSGGLIILPAVRLLYAGRHLLEAVGRASFAAGEWVGSH
jgi:hypothetical protein